MLHLAASRSLTQGLSGEKQICPVATDEDKVRIMQTERKLSNEGHVVRSVPVFECIAEKWK